MSDNSSWRLNRHALELRTLRGAAMQMKVAILSIVARKVARGGRGTMNTEVAEARIGAELRAFVLLRSKWRSRSFRGFLLVIELV